MPERPGTKRRNALQLDREYKDEEFRKKFIKLFAVASFIRNSIVQTGYVPNERYDQAISLSESGSELLFHVKNKLADKFAPLEIKLALFSKFFHNDLLVDLNSTDVNIIWQTLSDEVVAGKMKYPWIYDRVLYDRFFDMFPAQTGRLSHCETLLLLQDTSQGVFQLKDVIAGPFGLLRSSHDRFLRPLLVVPLWHCSDPSCTSFHDVQLTPGDSHFSSISELCYSTGEDVYGPLRNGAELSIIGQFLPNTTIMT